MKNSRTSLNKSFYDWIKEVREADKKIAELEEKLYYYNVKLIGYNSPNFEPRFSSTKPEYKDKRYIWLDKIIKTEIEIESLKIMMNKYKQFVQMLTKNELFILCQYINSYKRNNEYSRSNYYKILNEISRKFINMDKPNN